MKIIELPFNIGQAFKYRDEYYIISEKIDIREKCCKGCCFEEIECGSFPLDCRPSEEYPDGIIFKKVSKYELLFAKGDKDK